MHARHRQDQGRQHGIDLRHGTPGDKRQRTAMAFGQQRQRFNDTWRHMDAIGRGRQVDQGAVEVEEDGCPGRTQQLQQGRAIVKSLRHQSPLRRLMRLWASILVMTLSRWRKRAASSSMRPAQR